MANVKWITDSSHIPDDEQYILIRYGKENGLRRHGHGLTYSVDRTLNHNLLEAHVQTVISDARTLANFEKIDTVYVTIPKQVAQGN